MSCFGEISGSVPEAPKSFSTRREALGLLGLITRDISKNLTLDNEGNERRPNFSAAVYNYTIRH
jgi:hypothetical protein